MNTGKATKMKRWTTEAGLEAVVLFVGNSHNCGYVSVPKDSFLFGKDYGDTITDSRLVARMKEATIGKRGIIDALCCDVENPSFGVLFDVHGGVTYSRTGKGSVASAPDQWWYGYDCAHAGDATRCSDYPGDVFRDLDYCVAECESLARQIKELTDLIG